MIEALGDTQPPVRRVHHRVGDEFPWGAAERWLALVTDGPVARAYVELADAGEGAGPAVTRLALEAPAYAERARDDLTAALERRMGVPRPDPPDLRVSVVMCTHRRPELAARALAAFTVLRPAAHELVVVDSDPGAQDVRAAAEDAGARYLRVERRGLNRARAAGVEAATGDVVAFCDDDCIPPPEWLAPLPSAFADGTVGAVTGPAFALGVETQAQLLRDRYAGFTHAFELRRYDWTTVSPVLAGSIGAGANMALRKSLLAELSDPFPPELDAGTPTLSGGDLYALYRVLAAGAAIVRHPAFWLLHDHAPTEAALEATLRAYGTGFSAFLTKVLVEHRELETFVHWTWLVRAASEAVLQRLAFPEPGYAELRTRYLAAGFRGAPVWIRTRAGARARPVAAPPAAPVDEPAPAAAAVIAGGDAAERNAAARAATQPWLVFLPEGTLDPGRQASLHVRAHERAGRPAIVTGVEGVDRFGGSLTRQYGLLRAGRRAAAATTAAATPLDAGAAGLSLPRESFEALGGFREDLSAAGAATLLAFAARDAGLAIVLEPRAVTPAAVPEDLRGAAAAARREGRERAALAAAHPEVESIVSLSGAVAAAAARTDAGLVALTGAAALLEAARLRGHWIRVARAVHQGAFTRGWLEAGGRPLPLQARTTLDLREDRDVDLSRGLPGSVAVEAAGRHLRTIRVRGERWGAQLARDVVRALSPEHIGVAAPAPPPVAIEGDRLARCTVLLPAGSPDAAELAAAGATVAELGAADARWGEIDRAIREARTPRIALPFPGLEVSPEWLAVAAAPLDGPRVGAVAGWSAPAGAILPIATLFEARMRAYAYPLPGRPWEFLVLSRDAYLAAGEAPAHVARGDIEMGAIHVMERMLRDGRTVAWQQAPGAAWKGRGRAARAWARRRARGELLAREARELPARAAARWLIGHAGVPAAVAVGTALQSRSPGRMAAATAGAVATVTGVVAGLRA